MPSPTVLIADDEEAPREQLRLALRRHWPEAKLVAAAEHGVDAWDSFLEFEPAACFLDIAMPGLSGIDVAKRIAATGLPCGVVFCTAHSDHAVQAFDANAVDYVLKPIDDERFAQAVQRLKTRLAQSLAAPPGGVPLPPQLLAWLANQAPLQTPRPGLITLQASVGKEIRLIPVADVVYFESDARYTRVVYQQPADAAAVSAAVSAEALIRTPLKELLARLDDTQFWQVHRSVIVNTRCVASAVRIDENNMHLTLRGRPETLPVSRAFQGLFRGW